eukprot:m.386716 g.386716  ORF g.386716 m.386716 type:complete len:59 (+) comp21020_c1_seq8:250-426(+)
MATNFFNDAGSLDVLMTFKKLAVGPSVIGASGTLSGSRQLRSCVPARMHTRKHIVNKV